MKKKIIMMNNYIATLLHKNGFFLGAKVLSQQKEDWDISPNIYLPP